MILSIFFPKKGIKISQNFYLSFPEIDEIFSSRESETINFYSIFSPEEPPTSWKTSNKTISEEIVENDAIKPVVSNVQVENRELSKFPSIDFSTMSNTIFPIEYKKTGANPLKSFFESIKSERADKLVRIIHYGDSQIEEDRISRTLRKKLQNEFGGSGTGFFPVRAINNTSLSVSHAFSKNWESFSLFNDSHSYLQKSGFGILTEFSRFSPIRFNFAGENIFGAWVRISKQGQSGVNNDFEMISVLFSNVGSPLLIELYVDNNFRGVQSVNTNKSIQEVNWEFDNTPEKLQLNFRGNKSPDIYGISLDSRSGITVDNIALRGSSGLGFMNMNREVIRNMHEDLNVKLMIFQFGINLVRGLLKDYSEYEENLFNQLRTFKEISPDVSILIVGLSDMSRKIGGDYESFPNVELIRNVQKNAALRAGCAFWDLFEAMGGHNSMIQWVNANPPLARKDFAHFNLDGDRLVGELLYNAIIKEYYVFAN